MKLWVVAVGQRVPDWAQTAWDDYAKRFPSELKVELKAVKTEPRGSKTLPNLYAAGGAARGVSGAEVWGYLSGNGLLSAIAGGHIAAHAVAQKIRENT
jgi:hypothetical protein